MFSDIAIAAERRPTSTWTGPFMQKQAPITAHAPSSPCSDRRVCDVAAADIACLVPSEISQCVSDLLASGYAALAHALGNAALARHPDSPEVLASAALLAQARQDWAMADELLRRWVCVQADATPPEAWCQWVHVLRQWGEPRAALDVAIEGSRCHPGHAGLAEERASLEGTWRQCQLILASPHRH